MKFKNNNGITLVSLVIMIIILIILASITVYGGSQLIKRANIENLKTNMLLIQAEAKTAVEEFNFKENASSAEKDIQVDLLKEENLIGEKITEESLTKKVEKILKSSEENELDNYYFLDEEKLKEININIDLPQGEYYIIKYDFENITAEIYYTKGYKYNGDTLYSLTELNNVRD